MILKITDENITDFYVEDDIFNTQKEVIDTVSQNKIETCNNHEFFCQNIHKIP